MNTRHIILSLFALAASIFIASAQENPQAEHNKLTSHEATLKHRADSLQTLLSLKRTAFDSDTQNDNLASDIIALEGTLYDLRSELSRVGAKIAALDATLAKSSFNTSANAPKASATNQTSSRNILHATFFRTNISQKDRNLFATTPKVIELINQQSLQIDKIYTNLLALKSLFDDVQSQQELDQMITEAENLKRQIIQIDNQLSSNWNTLYNKKLDNYLVLSDKIGGIDRSTLENLDALSRQVLQMQSNASYSLAPTIAGLHAQQSLILEYEMLFAQKLKINEAIDSIKIQQAKLPSLVGKQYSDISFPYRSLVIYSPITLGHTYPYSDIKEVPEVKIPQNGVYYAVQVALVASHASSLTIFKGAQPLQVETLANGSRRYIIGGYKTYDDGYAAVKQCYSSGFKNPVLVAWVNGQFTTAAKAKAYQVANPNENSGADFQIQILSSGTQTASVIKNTLDINSPGKSISRVEQDGKFLYTISRFTTQEEAQVIAHILKTKEPNIENIVVQPIQ